MELTATSNQACSFLSTTLVACEATNDRTSFYDWNVANSVFYGVTTFLLLFVVIYTLNTMLRKHLGHSPSALKVVAGLALFVLGGLLVPYIVIQCYLSWQYRDISKTPDIKIDVFATRYISLAFDGMFLICVLGFGALSIRTARSIKKKYGTSNVSTSVGRHMPSLTHKQSLTIRISVLVISLVGLNMVSIIYTAGMMSYHIFFTSASYVVIFYLLSIFPAIAFVSIIVIAKDPAWKFNNHEPTTIQSQQFAYYQQDPPVHGGVRSV